MDINIDKLLSEMLDWVKQHSWYCKYSSKIKKKDLDSLRRLVNEMDYFGESEMNNAFFRIPKEERCSSLLVEIYISFIKSKRV